MKKLKKILSLFTLIVVVGSEILTSFSYALNDLLENSEDVQVEIVEETEEVIDEDSSDEVFEDDEGIQEIDKEDSKEKLDNGIVQEIQENENGMLDEFEGSVEEKVDENAEEERNDDSDDNVNVQNFDEEDDEEDLEENLSGGNLDDEQENTGSQDIDEETVGNSDLSDDKIEIGDDDGESGDEDTEVGDTDKEENNLIENEKDGEDVQGESLEESSAEISEGQNNEGIVENMSENLETIITKIRYFFKKEGDSRYIKYGRDGNNIGTITLKDPKNSASITIMDKNLGAKVVGVGNGSYGYYFQWGNNHGVETVNSANKTTQKAVYRDGYYNHGYDGRGEFIIGSSDYWENGDHYNSLWGNESKESSRYGACPVGYHIPTIKEWNQLLNIWGNIHTQDNSEGKTTLRYSANYSTRNIHAFKSAATQCEQGDNECVDEDKISSIAEILSSELKLPLAGSYDENGNFHDGLGVYWTSVSKNGNAAGVFDMNAYIGEREDGVLQYKAQGHNIRCFKNVEPYEAPVNLEIQNEESSSNSESMDSLVDESISEGQIGTGIDSQQNGVNVDGSQNFEENIQDSYPENNIPSDIESNPIIQDTTGDSVNKETNTKEYTITWKNEDGSVRDITTVEYGQMPMHEDPVQPSDARYSYKFAGWEPELKIVDGDAVYKAKYIYIPIEYTITWKNEDGTIIDTSKVAYGQTPTHANPNQPADEKYSYKFAGWVPNLSEVKGNTEYRAKYEYIVNMATITWKNEDGTIIDTTEVPYGEMPTHANPNQPADAHYSYEFSGWNPEISEVKGPVEYRAIYKYIVNKYTVIRQNEDGTILETDEEVEYGSIPTYDGEIPVKQSDGIYEYSFEGWNSVVSEVTGDIVYIATYNAEEIGQNIQDVILETSEGQEDIENDNNSQSGEEELFSPDGGESYLGDNEENIQNSLGESPEGNADNKDSSTNISEGENTIQEGKNLEEGQGFFGGLWKTLKSFFLDDEEDGYLRGSETIDDILVSVEAEEGTFPVGTEVVIKGVSEERLETIQTSLVEDENNNVTENAQIVAFDISFIYSGEEIQPEKEVSVKFNYKDNTDFQGASEKELGVYHIDDETDEGTEIQVTSKDGDEIEILATDFSIYVLTLSDSNSIKLTLNPGDGTLITGSNIVVDEQGIGTITSVDGNVTLPNATRANYVFVGWYTSQTPSLQSFVGNGGDEYHVNSNTTLYAIWCNNGYTINTEKTACILPGNLKTIMDQNPNFTYGQIGFLRPDGWENDEDPAAIVIMDRNLGASSFGTDTRAWGYYYQWGNNYGFTQNPPTIVRNIANINLSLYGPGNPYYSGTFVIGNVDGTTFQSWATTQNYNIWGYNTDEDEDKQGPCPDGWHVPSIDEWNRLVGYWTGNNGGMNVSKFRSELGLPLAGGITRSYATLESGGIQGWYRTVTPNISSQFSYDFQVSADSYNGNYSENLVNGRQIRCFMNKGGSLPIFTVVYVDGIEDREIFEDQIYSGLELGDTFPSFSGDIHPWTGNDGKFYEFFGWALSGMDTFFDVSGARVSQNMVLYAKWNLVCPDGEYEGPDNQCHTEAENQRLSQIVVDLDLYYLVSDGNSDNKQYTIMDRNMGATSLYNKNFTSPNNGSKGYLYQWGNNYGFPSTGDSNNLPNSVPTTKNQVPKNIWGEYVPSRYASGVYYLNNNKDGNWMAGSTSSDGIWGGTGDTYLADGIGTTLEGRQGPCPTGYHVPSSVEWQNLFDLYPGNETASNVQQFTYDLLIPPVGRRAQNGTLGNTTSLSYWSSSPSSDSSKAMGFYWEKNKAIERYQSDGRARARSVRCFKNTGSEFVSKEDIHLNGGTNVFISIHSGTILSLGTPTLTSAQSAQATFDGWYTTSDFSGNPLSTGDTVSAGSSLYAKFTCNESGYIWNGSGCEGGIRLYFDSMGGTEVSSQLIKSGTTGVRPADPTKTGYAFSGWYLTGETENEFNFTGTIITESTTLYAHWNTGQYEVSIVSNNEDYGTVDSGSIIADYGTPLSTNENELTIGFTTVIATPATSGEQYTYTFSGWTFENCGIEGAESVTTNCEITANFDRISNGYTVIWNNSDGTTLEIDLNVPYGTIPSYDGETPTSGGNAQYSYIFTGWSPATGIVQGDITYTATYTQSVNAYTVMIQSSDVNSGTVTTGSITVPYGTNISKSGNILEIGNETSTANPNPQTWQFDFAFVDWTNTCGTTVITGCTVTANFQSIVRTYTLDLVIGTGIETIYYKINGLDGFINTGITTMITGVEAGSTIYLYAEAKDGYTYTETSVSNPWSVIVTGDNIFAPEAVAGGVQYIVYHYVKRIGSIKYDLVKTDTGVGVTDEILELSGLSKENEFPCAHYVRGSLTGTEDGPGEIVTQATIKGDGSTKIYLYYTRNSYTVHLSGDAGIQSLEINENESTEAVRECGSEVPVNAKPKPGYHFVRWDRIERNESEGESETSGEG